MTHSLPPKAKKACIMTIVLANAAIIAASLFALLSQGCLIPGGSEACNTDSDDCPVMASDLDGTWCDSHSPQTCLTVFQYPAGARYALTIGQCLEQGELTGGLEFDPDTDSRVCLPGFGYDLWCALSASFTNHGLYLYDISQCQGQVCDENAFVYANDLDLSYVR